MRTTPRSETEAKKVSERKLLVPGWHQGRITEAVEKASSKGNDMIELVVMVADGAGDDRTLRDWLTDSSAAALRLRHAAKAVGALAQYESGDIGQDDFPGHDVGVKIGVEKRRGYPERNVILDYTAPEKAP